MLWCPNMYGKYDTSNKCNNYNAHVRCHLRKPRVLSPLPSIRTCVWNKVDLVPLPCENGYRGKNKIFAQESAGGLS